MMDFLLPPNAIDTDKLIFLPEHQKAASLELNKAIAAAAQTALDQMNKHKTAAKEYRLRILTRAIDEAVQQWMHKYPSISKLSIGFETEWDMDTGRIRINPSHDMQRLMAGLITF
jgi:hypothetical protein